MNSGRQLFQLSRSVLRQQGLRRNMSETGGFQEQKEVVMDQIQYVNKEGLYVAKGLFGGFMLYTIGRVAWLHYHVFPLTEEPEESGTPTWR